MSLLPVALVLFGFAAIVLAATIDQALLAKFAQLERQYALPDGVLAKVARVESEGDALAYNKGSGALGMFQWLESSWLYQTKKAYGKPLSPEGRKDPALSAEMTAIALADTKAAIGGLITQAKVDMIVGLYMGHFLGTAGAKKFFTLMLQDPNAPAAPYFPKAAEKNKQIFYKNGSQTSFADIVNGFAAQLKAPGITSVRNYTGSYSGNLKESRILFDGSQGYLKQWYTGPMPAPDSQFDYPYQSEPLPPGSCAPTLYCADRGVMSRDSSCNVTVREECPYGCMDNRCLGPGGSMQQRCPDGSLPLGGQCMSQRCPDGSLPVYGQCRQQTCPQGMIPYGGTCYPMQGSQQMQPFQTGSIGGMQPTSASQPYGVSSQQPFGSSVTTQPSYTTTDGTVGTGVTSGGTAQTVGTPATVAGSGQTTGSTGGSTGASDPASRLILDDGSLASSQTSGGSKPVTATSPNRIAIFEDYGEIGNTASGMQRGGFDLLSALESPNSLVPFSGGPDTTGFGAQGRTDTAGMGQGATQGALSPTGRGQETFTSPDMRDLPAVGAPSSPSQSSGFVARVLENLRVALLKALDFLISLRVRLVQQR